MGYGGNDVGNKGEALIIVDDKKDKECRKSMEESEEDVL